MSLIQDVKTHWWSMHILLERIVEMKDVILQLFAVEFHNRMSQNVETNLEQVQLCKEDFVYHKDLLHVLTPFKAAQEALEGENYDTISLIPVLIYMCCPKLNEVLAAMDDNMQPELYDLLSNISIHFSSRWGVNTTYSFNTVWAHQNHQVGIHRYTFWACALDLHTKKKLKKNYQARSVATLD